ncbi:hypothetical protein FHS77_000709 [Paenochrobactrum gallinarii]|uniref:Uncharacterized protein n=1 Tax=Paenochrobactrum gallinarii TaxID=643673 RepID=A0A841LQ42_9HYPH|nr:hypothetical protein [Paenochrobactrum gallinarii]MBB6260185.1 hypothetical protein [Paenochrobactrum gallinarii]
MPQLKVPALTAKIERAAWQPFFLLQRHFIDFAKLGNFESILNLKRCVLIKKIGF